MAKNKPKRKKDQTAGAFPDASTPTAPSSAPPPAAQGKRWYLIAMFVGIALGGTYLAQAINNAPAADVPRYTYNLVKTYPHDSGAFTQGLYLEDGVVWESTGKNGQSSIRKVDLASGDILKQVDLPENEFGEGVAMVGDKLYQLTWKKGLCHVYDRELNKIKDFEYQGQGWGLTYDGTHLIMSDGSSRLYFIDPETFENVRMVTVFSGRKRIGQLNELEYAGGKIWANVWNSESLYAINPSDGKVVGILNLGGLWPLNQRPAEGIMNGIAVDSATEQIIVTGKYCPSIFEIELKDLPSR